MTDCPSEVQRLGEVVPTRVGCSRPAGLSDALWALSVVLSDLADAMERGELEHKEGEQKLLTERPETLRRQAAKALRSYTTRATTGAAYLMICSTLSSVSA